MDVSFQRRMASEILKCGYDRVWIDPNALEDVAEAVTRADVRSLIKDGLIVKKQKIGISRGRTRHVMEQKRKGKRKGQGSRKGPKYARMPHKQQWMQTIRPIRKRLRELRDSGVIDATTYRRYYRYSKGGMFRNRAHMESHIEIDKAREGR